jgi:hypothetical protein
MIRQLLGWTAVIAVTALASFWAFWGSIEAFHEGWYAPTLAARLAWALVYLAPALTLALLGVTAIRWPIVGAGLFAALGVVMIVLTWFGAARFHYTVTLMFTLAPLVLGLLYAAGRPRPRRLASVCAAGVPLLVMVVSGSGPAYRVSVRIDDGDRGERIVVGNGVTLVWAPAGPAWERRGNVSWQEAVDRCRYVTDDGLHVASDPKDAWRMPTVDEVVRSTTYHGRNSGGMWDSERHRASYRTQPDKESPLWDPYSPVIYWWTNSDVEAGKAWTVAYNGGTLGRRKPSGGPASDFVR